MALCRLSGTLAQQNGRPSVGTIVQTTLASFPVGNRRNGDATQTRTNQQGVFAVDLTQGDSVRIVIRDLGIDITATIPATPTTTLAALMV